MKNLQVFNREHRLNRLNSSLQWKFEDFLEQSTKTIDKQNEALKSAKNAKFDNFNGLLIQWPEWM